jgi:hypothetical protein
VAPAFTVERSGSVASDGTLTTTERPCTGVNRSSLAIGLAGLLAGVAVLLAVVGLRQPVLWLPALASAAASYRLWDYGRERILAEGYGDAGPHDADGDADRERRRVGTEDWHNRGFEYRPEEEAAGTEAAEATETDDERDDWRWDGPFWHEGTETGAGTEADGGRTGERGSDPRAGDVGGRATAGDDPWRDRRGDEGANRWPGWEEWTGGGDRADDGGRPGGHGRRTRKDGTGRGRRGGRTRGTDRGATGQRQVSRRRRNAAAVLGVDPDAPPETVRAAYRDRVKEVHPDCGGSEEAFRRVRWAYELLRE